MNQKLTGFAVILLLLAVFPTATAALDFDTFAIEQINPDSNNRFRDGRIKGFFFANASTDYEAQMWVQQPNGTWVHLGTESGKVNSGTSRDLLYKLPETRINEFGTYTFKFNETFNPDAVDTFSYEIIPDVTTVVQPRADEIILNDDTDKIIVDVFVAGTDPSMDEPIFKELQPGNAEVFDVFPNGTSRRIKTVKASRFRKDNKTELMTVALNDSTFSPGFHRVQINYSIDSPNEDYFQDATATLEIKRNSINTMAAQLSVLLALLFAGGLFAYLGMKLNPENKIVAVLRVFLVMLAPLFAVAAVFAGTQFAADAGFAGVNSWMSAVLLGTFMAWFVILFVLGLVLYMTDAFKAAAVTGGQEFQQDEV